eukprot:5509794-Pleurochrysis_carterae.AAC.3
MQQALTKRAALSAPAPVYGHGRPPLNAMHSTSCGCICSTRLEMPAQSGERKRGVDRRACSVSLFNATCRKEPAPYGV